MKTYRTAYLPLPERADASLFVPLDEADRITSAIPCSCDHCKGKVADWNAITVGKSG